MYLLGIIIAIISTSVVSNIYFRYKSASGTIDVSWNEETNSWDGLMHLSKSINFSEKDKLIIKINHK
jgi:hypothetical protein